MLASEDSVDVELKVDRPLVESGVSAEAVEAEDDKDSD